jgi:ABC-type polysaccharide/polyol phosphate transport system ATPase subunit
MRLVLVSLLSKEDNAGGLAVFDLDNSCFKYLQLFDFNGLPGRICHIRGVHWMGEKLYAVAPFAMFCLKPGNLSRGPGLVLDKTVILREWLLGPEHQGNLHAVHASAQSGRVHVSFNTQGSIDTFDPSGKYLQRRYLWDMHPAFFPLPTAVPEQKAFRFGLVRHIMDRHGQGQLLTISHVNETSQGILLDAERGEILLRTPFNPHGSVLFGDKLYLSDIEAGMIHAYSWAEATRTVSPDRVFTFQPVVDGNRWPASVQNVRGMAVLYNRLICGVCYFGKVASTQIPPRIVEFDLENGEQKAEHFLPSVDGMYRPQVYAITEVPPWLAETVSAWEEPKYYYGETRLVAPIGLGKLMLDPGLARSEANTDRPDRSRKVATPGQLTDIGLNPTAPPPDSVIRSCEHPDVSEVAERRKVSNFKLSPCITLDRVGLFFVRRAKSIFSINNRLKRNRIYWGLQDVSFTLHEGESVGVIGRNGSGKSTLSLVCAGVYKPDSGRVMIRGKVHLLALGVGFKSELTGRENIFLSAGLLGLSRREIQKKVPDIEAFAELDGFLDEPVRTYSSGMRSKLGFAVATAVEPEILILDEALSVGDKAFQDKAVSRMRTMREKAKSVLIVSHNPGQLKKLCSRVVWLEQGRVILVGEPGEVLHAYDVFCMNPNKWLIRHGYDRLF